MGRQMSRFIGREIQRTIQSRAGLVSVAALFYLSSAMETEAEPATSDERPTTQQAPAPQQVPTAVPAQASPAGQTPSGAPPATAEQKTDVPIPPVSVQAPRPRAPTPVQAAPAPTVVAPPPPPPPTQPVAAPGLDSARLGATPYQVSNTGITRLPVPILNTPQTINVIPQQIIQEQSISTVEDALRYIPGITFSAGEGGQQGDGPIIRGFVARGDLFRDGIRDPGWYTRDAFSIDRVEVYKGPSAFAFGRGATGGAINTVTKLPTGVPYLESTSTVMTGNGYREVIDASGKKDNISGRIAALFQDVNTPTRDGIWTKRWGVAPSMVYDFKQGTKATLSYVYQGEEGVSDYGFTYLPQPTFNPVTGAIISPGYYGGGRPTPPLPVPRTNFYGLPGGPLGDITQVQTHIVTAKVEHEFEKDIKISNATRYVDNERFARVTAPRSVGLADNNFPGKPPAPPNPTIWDGTTFPFNYPVDQLTLGRERRERETDNTYLVNQTDFVAKIDTGPLKHTIASGLELSRETRHQDRRDLCDPAVPACRTNVVDPDPNGSPIGGAIKVYQPIDTKATNVAAFISDQVKINKYIELLASLRVDQFFTDYTDPNQAKAVNQHLQRLDNLFSYRFGAVYHPTEKSSVYIAYGNSYNPSAELGTIANASSAALAPEQTHSIEVGAKADLLGGKLSLSGAVFRIEKTNLRISDPADNTVSVLDGVARVDGVELGAVGKVTDEWSVFTGYSYLESSILDTHDLSILGKHLPNTPRHNFTLWTTYDLTKKWTVGGGAIYQSLGWANTTNSSYVPEFWKFDAMVSYKVDDKSTVQLNIYNLTDKLYYSQYFGGNVVPASGRWASLTYRTRW
jgi:catecholate siderophore receptor